MSVRTVVFGGAGFAGLNIVEALLKRGQTVCVFDRSPVPRAAAVAFAVYPGRLEAIASDVRDPSAIAHAIEPGTDGVVFGTAITANAARDASHPSLVLETNLLSLVPVLERAREMGVRRVVNMSSVAAYGATGEHVPLLDETAPVDPQTLYAVTKFASERVADRLAGLWGTDVVSVRLCSVFGPWEYATGLRDTLSPHLQVMQAAEAGRAALLPRPIERDWIYAPDMADGVAAVLTAPKLGHRLYNISPGKTWSILAFGQEVATHRVGFVCRVAVPGETANIDPHAPSDRAPLSPERLAADLGWRAPTTLSAAVAGYEAWWRASAAGLRHET